MLYIRNVDTSNVGYTEVHDTDGVPEQWRMQCMLLDAASDSEGKAEVEYVGHRVENNGGVYYHLSKIWRRVYTTREYGKMRVAVSNEPRAENVGTTLVPTARASRPLP